MGSIIDKFWKEFTDLKKQIILSEAQSQAFKTGFFSVTDDPELEKKVSDCYTVLIPDGFSQVQCFGRLAGEIIYNVNNVIGGIQGVSLFLKRDSLDLVYQYLRLYYLLDSDNHPQALAEALSEIANNKLSKEDAEEYQFLSFNQASDKDLEKALDLLSMVNGYAVKEPLFDAVFSFNYKYNYAKQTILDKQNFINHTTEFYMNNLDKSLLYDIDSEYLDVDIQIEPSENQDYFKACVNVDNISSVYIEGIRGKLNLYLDEKLIKIDNLFVGDLSHTTNTFAQRCSEEFPLIFNEKILSIGIIKAEYNFKYLPHYYKNTEEREQVGNKYFEINKHKFTDDVAKPIIKLTIPKIVRPKEKIKLDASQTVSFINNDKFKFKWEYIASNSSVDVGLTWNDTSSGIAYITVPNLPADMVFYRHDFKLTVTSETNGIESVKEFSIFVKNEKQEEETVDDNTETSNNQDDNSDTSLNNSNTEDNANNNTPSTDTPSNSSRTSIEYMKNHKTEKLASTDCKVRNYKGWKDAKNELIYSLAPADNMMKSIEGCIDVIKLTELGGLSFSKAVESVVRSRTKETSPFSDVWDNSARETPTLTVDEVTEAQNNADNSSNLTSGTLTIEKCKSKYGNYTNAQWASSQGSGEYKGEATACYQAIVVAPSMGIDGQSYIDAYNRGVYGK